jgi:hypothetical protein
MCRSTYQEFLSNATKHLLVAFGCLSVLSREVDFEAGFFEGSVRDACLCWIMAVIAHGNQDFGSSHFED